MTLTFVVDKLHWANELFLAITQVARPGLLQTLRCGFVPIQMLSKLMGVLKPPDTFLALVIKSRIPFTFHGEMKIVTRVLQGRHPIIVIHPKHIQAGVTLVFGARPTPFLARGHLTLIF